MGPRRGGIAAWSVDHPIGVSLIAAAVCVLGLVAYASLRVDLLPRIIYPEVRVRVLDPGVPPTVMEDRVTRQLEEQLAITEGAVSVQSFTTEGRSAVDLSFPYGTDVDAALRDASNRLDRARRFLPDTIRPPIIFKRDPSQIPVLELVASSERRGPVALREWVDYTLSRWLINLPGVAAVEVGGGLEREVSVTADPVRLADLGLDHEDLARVIAAGARDQPGGRLSGALRAWTARAVAGVEGAAALAALPLRAGERRLRLGDVATVTEGHEPERLRVRLNGLPGVKASIQKQPEANTVEVVDHVRARLAWLRAQGLIPDDVEIRAVGDQSRFIRHAIRNAAQAALTGAALAMLVVYLFLGDLRRTLVIGTAIPIAILVTFAGMAAGGLTLNVMTLGGLAVGVGLLVDSTIVMLENVHRHQRLGEGAREAALRAAGEVTSPIVAATSTNLAAVLPFLFVGGLVGLLFRELILTIALAIFSSMVVALTLVPALGARVRDRAPGRLRRAADALMARLRAAYTGLVRAVLKRPWAVPALLLPLLALALAWMAGARQAFLPTPDEGRIYVRVTGDPGITLDDMDAAVSRIEELILAQREVETAYTVVGGFVFGRSEYETPNRSGITVQLVPAGERAASSEAFAERLRRGIRKAGLPGVRVRIHVAGVRGVRLGRGDDDLSLRVRGPDLATLARIGERIVERLRGVRGLRNLAHTYEDPGQEIAVRIDPARAADLGVDAEAVGRTLRAALEGLEVGELMRGDRAVPVRLRLKGAAARDPAALGDLVVREAGGRPVRIADVARIELVAAPPRIQRDRQQRIVEVTGSFAAGADPEAVMAEVRARLRDLELPEGYALYEAGALEALRHGRRLGLALLGLAVFLVFVVMAVQYESLRDPAVILASVPFALLGVAIGLWATGMPLSMPVWLGLIMLAGIVVNNAIVLVEQIRIERARGRALDEAVVEAAGNRLRPILMTVLTTVLGMTPLALGLGEGSELLQPLAVVMVWGLALSTVVSLVLVPAVYRLAHARG